MKIELMRTQTGDTGTFGKLKAGDKTFYTAELPWRGNERSVSCIPEGAYTVKPHVSPKFGECYLLENVTGRSNILIHVGNFAGDKSKGYRSDVEGCILIGEKIVSDGRQQMVSNSRKAFGDFSKIMGKNPFELIIKSAD